MRGCSEKVLKGLKVEVEGSGSRIPNVGFQLLSTFGGTVDGVASLSTYTVPSIPLANIFWKGEWKGEITT